MAKHKLEEVFWKRLQEKKLIAAVKDMKRFEQVFTYEENIAAALLMAGNILTVKNYVDSLQDKGIPVILHVEKIQGLKLDHYGLDFIRQYVRPFAIVTTKADVIKRAKEQGIFVIQRIFLIDTDVYEHLLQSLRHMRADMIEIMPSRSPDFVKRLTEHTDIPVITGGLLNEVQYAEAAVSSGASAVSTSNLEIWKTDLSKL